MDSSISAAASSTAASSDTGGESAGGDTVRDGVMRRYLMQESKVNSTLKVGILMVQVDGERNFVAPPLKTAPVFGNIAGIVVAEPLDTATDMMAGLTTGPADSSGSQLPPVSKSRDAYELQDLYRRALAASWASQPHELAADECIEDIFAGGDGFRTGGDPQHSSDTSIQQLAHAGPGNISAVPRSAGGDHARSPITEGFPSLTRDDSGSGDEGHGSAGAGGLTMRASRSMMRQGHSQQQHHHTLSPHSMMSDRSGGTVTAFPIFKEPRLSGEHGSHRNHRRDLKDDNSSIDPRSRSESLTSLATNMGSDRGRDGFKRLREVEEYEVREDLVAWKLPGVVS
jgi:hypothetical protein